METCISILKKYWGYDQFRAGQEAIIQSVLEGKDTLALLPTGGGKSICFQVPALAKEGLCLVISPLIALIKDQVEGLKRKGIPTLSIFSGMQFSEVRKTLENAQHGNFKFLYVSPERLKTSLFLEYLPVLKISLIAVDEAHCISQWGYDFRPAYLQIASLRNELPDTPILALTASATKQVQDDICRNLSFHKGYHRFQGDFSRPNLSYSVFNVDSKQKKLAEILTRIPGSAIVYCKTRKQTTQVSDICRMNKIESDFYHAGLSNEERNKKQESWIRNQNRVMVCTNAFGMGIDKPDVRTVVHYDVPDCLENYYQEAGRAGRDGKRSYAVLLYTDTGIKDMKELVALRFPDSRVITEVYHAVMNHLQIPSGSGEGININFDIAAFSAAFKIPLITANYAIKALEQEGFFTLNDIFFQPSRVVFCCSRQVLHIFYKDYPQYEEILKGLLRSYEGIFDFPTDIDENKLAHFVKKDQGQIIQELHFLHQMGILEYNPQKDKPQLLLLQNRMHHSNFHIDTGAYENRKKAYEERMERMFAYLNESKTCRSSFLSEYFSAPVSNDCGICDNCLNKKKQRISDEEFRTVSNHILNEKDWFTPNELIKNLHPIMKDKIWQVIEFLLAEQKIQFNAEGRIMNKQ